MTSTIITMGPLGPPTTSLATLHTYMLGLGFTRRKVDHCVYFKLNGDHFIYLVLYVDDMLLIGNNKEIIQDVKT